jgi:hypothetical protein
MSQGSHLTQDDSRKTNNIAGISCNKASLQLIRAATFFLSDTHRYCNIMFTSASSEVIKNVTICSLNLLPPTAFSTLWMSKPTRTNYLARMSGTATAAMHIKFMAVRLSMCDECRRVCRNGNQTGNRQNKNAMFDVTWRTRHQHSLRRPRQCVRTPIKFHTVWEDPVNCCNNYTLLPLSQLWYSSALNFRANAPAMSTVRLFLCRNIGANNARWRTGLPLLYITNSVCRNAGQAGTSLQR